MSRLRCFVLLPLVLGVLASLSPAQHSWVQEPGSGHWYSRTALPQTWVQSQDEALALGGSLVVIDDAAENSWVHQTFVASGVAMAAYGPWIGYYQDTASAQFSEPGGGWSWVHSSSTYTRWGWGEPNNGAGGVSEEYAHFLGKSAPDWNDVPGDQSGGLYGIIELETAPGLVLHVDGLVTGSQATLLVAGANMGDLIGLGYSLTGPGPTPIPGLPGMILDLGLPFYVLGVQVADATGVVSLTTPAVPPGVAGLPIWFDAVVLTSPYGSPAGVGLTIQ